MVWRKYDGEGGWYGPGLHLARSRNNRSHWVNMGARLWKCSREQLRLATDEEGLSKEVALALSQEMLDDVDSGRSARFIDVTSDGAPPAEAVLIRAMEPSQDQPEAVPEEPEPAESPSDPPPEPFASPSGILADGEADESQGTVAIAPAEASGFTPSVRPRDDPLA